MKTFASLVAVAALAASITTPALAGPLATPDAQPTALQRVSQQDWRSSCYRGESYTDCQRRLSYGNQQYGGGYGGSYSGGYGSGYNSGSGYGGSYSGGSDRDPRYYAPGGYYDRYVQGGGYNNGSGYNNGYGSGGYNSGYGSGGYNSGYGSGGYSGYNTGYGYNDGRYNQNQTDWGSIAGAVLGVALGVAIIGSLDDRDDYDRYRDDRRYRDHCRSRYNSYDGDSGTYLGNDGYRRYCRWN